MNKLAMFADYYRQLGAAEATTQMQGQEKTAFLGRALSKAIPKTRGGKAAAGLLGGLGAIGAYKATRPEPSMVDNLYEGGRELYEDGKDALSNMSPEELMGYQRLLEQLYAGADMQGYDAASGADSVDPSLYTMSDIGMDPYGSMGYEAPMSPQEADMYYDVYGANQYYGDE